MFFFVYLPIIAIVDDMVQLRSDMEKVYKAGYDAGYVVGAASGSASSDVTKITYTVRHTHVNGCYGLINPPASAVLNQWVTSGDDGSGGYVDDYHASYTCSYCKTVIARGDKKWDKAEALRRAQAQLATQRHVVNGKCMAYKIQSSTPTCGKTPGDRTTQDIATLGVGDSVVSATVDFD